MIRICSEKDRKWILDYLYQDAAYNIFFIGDIEHFGFDSDFQQVYVEEEQNVIKAVFLRYRDNGVYYTKEPYFNPELTKLIDHHQLIHLSGKTELMDIVDPYIPNFEKQQTYFCATDRKKLKIEKPSSGIVKKMTSNIRDIERLYQLLHLITEFGYHSQTLESFIDAKLKSISMGNTYFIEEDGIIVSTVAVTAETTINGMVVAVATHPDYRNKGYATILMKQLIYDYLVEKKKDLCLFYNNPKAGHIYISLGFEPIGQWSMYHKK